VLERLVHVVATASREDADALELVEQLVAG
jgi:hypothetical protein